MKNAPFLAPTSVKAKQDGSLIYCPHRVQIVKEVTFDAAHHLFDYDGKCRALHGHTYKLQMGISGFLDNRGMTLDFGDLKAIFKEELEPYLDHRYLNESLWIFEQLAKHLPDERDVRVEFVKLYETPTSYAEFRREWLVD